MDNKFIFAGFGGQGILFAGKVAVAAGLKCEKEVSWLPSYGPEMRGGTANCSVCISDEPIGSPLVINPDVLIAMNQPSFDKFIDKIVPGGTAVIDSTLVKAENVRDDIKLIEIPATALAEENGLKGLANIIMLGKVFEETQFATFEGLAAGVEYAVPASKKHLIEPNMKAIEIGRNYR